jgi:hypothetical protein
MRRSYYAAIGAFAAVQVNRGSISESLTSSAHRSAMTAIEWLHL